MKYGVGDLVIALYDVQVKNQVIRHVDSVRGDLYTLKFHCAFTERHAARHTLHASELGIVCAIDRHVKSARRRITDLRPVRFDLALVLAELGAPLTFSAAPRSLWTTEEWEKAGIAMSGIAQGR